MYGEGISKEGCIIELAVAKDIIEKSGSWFSYKGERIGQGKDNARLFLKENTKMRDEIEALIRGNIASAAVGGGEHVEEQEDISLDSEILGIDL
jgi:recombination protein RecA